LPAPRTTPAGSKPSPARKSAPAAGTTAKRSPSNPKSTAAAVPSGVKATATSTRKTADKTASNAKSGATATSADQRAGRQIKPRDLVMLTRERIQETLDEAAARGRVTRKDANELVAELVRRGRSQTDELVGDVEQLLERGREQLETATKRARKTEPVDRLVRGADRARRAAGVGPSFPILGYDDLNVGQVRERLKDLRKPELRKVRAYESKHANRKSVLAAIDKSLA
jgi:polyhydroxyalkanoate synthesis regulator phasin